MLYVVIHGVAVSNVLALNIDFTCRVLGPIMPAYAAMLQVHYYAPIYASIIRQCLFIPLKVPLK